MRLREGTIKVRLLAKIHEFDRNLPAMSIRLILCRHLVMAKALIEGGLMIHVRNVHKDAVILAYGTGSLIS